MSEANPSVTAFWMCGFGVAPGVGLFFLTDGATWAAVLAGVLAIPFGFFGGALFLSWHDFRTQGR